MPTAIPNQEQRDMLQNLRAGWTFVHTSSQSAPLTPNGLPEPGRAKPGEECKCMLVEQVTQKAFLVAVGPDEQVAFNRVMEKAKTAERPQTPAEMAVELAELKKELAAVTSTRPEAPFGSKPRRVSATALAEQLKARGLSVPDGKRTTKTWRAEAMQRLADDEQLDGEGDVALAG
tara:strand:- start:294 stop:818 length:525 start_codon:yes stop_codon:yes gene_type:complete